jgi:hypothetical protein
MSSLPEDMFEPIGEVIHEVIIVLRQTVKFMISILVKASRIRPSAVWTVMIKAMSSIAFPTRLQLVYKPRPRNQRFSPSASEPAQ